MCFDILIHILIGIVIRAVRWQEKYLNPILVFFDPFLNLFCMMNAEIIHNNEDFSPGILYHSPKKLQKCVHSQRTLVHHEPHFTLVVYRIYHARVKSLARTLNDGCLAFWRITSAAIVFA